MNSIPSDWLEEHQDSDLDVAIEATLSQPIDGLAVERIKLRARAIASNQATSTPMTSSLISSDPATIVQRWSVLKRSPPIKLLAVIAASIAIVVWWTMSSSSFAIAPVADIISALNQCDKISSISLCNVHGRSGSLRRDYQNQRPIDSLRLWSTGTDLRSCQS